VRELPSVKITDEIFSYSSVRQHFQDSAGQRIPMEAQHSRVHHGLALQSIGGGPLVQNVLELRAGNLGLEITSNATLST
jgi:hypothetical protein